MYVNRLPPLHHAHTLIERVHVYLWICIGFNIWFLIVDKAKSDLRYIESEIEILKTCSSHENVLRLLDVYENDGETDILGISSPNCYVV